MGSNRTASLAYFSDIVVLLSLVIQPGQIENKPSVIRKLPRSALEQRLGAIHILPEDQFRSEVVQHLGILRSDLVPARIHGEVIPPITTLADGAQSENHGEH